jgi:hypothetical protein
MRMAAEIGVQYCRLLVSQESRPTWGLRPIYESGTPDCVCGRVFVWQGSKQWMAMGYLNLGVCFRVEVRDV